MPGVRGERFPTAGAVILGQPEDTKLRPQLSQFPDCLPSLEQPDALKEPGFPLRWLTARESSTHSGYRRTGQNFPNDGGRTFRNRYRRLLSRQVDGTRYPLRGREKLAWMLCEEEGPNAQLRYGA